MPQNDSKMAASVSNKFCTYVKNVSTVPSNCERSWFETCSTAVFPCWIDDFAFQRRELEDIQPFPIALPSSKFVSNYNTPEKRSFSTGHEYSRCYLLLIVHAIVWCSSATIPDLQIFSWMVNIYDSKLFTRQGSRY